MPKAPRWWEAEPGFELLAAQVSERVHSPSRGSGQNKMESPPVLLVVASLENSVYFTPIKNKAKQNK